MPIHCISFQPHWEGLKKALHSCKGYYRSFGQVKQAEQLAMPCDFLLTGCDSVLPYWIA